LLRLAHRTPAPEGPPCRRVPGAVADAGWCRL